MGFYPDLYVLQIVYYSFCMVILTAGLIYATSAVTVFFRDMKEVVAILLQIGMWVTPIMWNFESMQGIPKWAVVLLKLNPMYYIVSGYRDALINKTAFWEHPGLTLWSGESRCLHFGRERPYLSVCVYISQMCCRSIARMKTVE